MIEKKHIDISNTLSSDPDIFQAEKAADIKSKRNHQNMDMLHGTITDKLFLIAVPLVLSSALQQLFNAADIAVVGRFAGQNALAAVGANSPVINLFVNLFVGLSIGANAVISRFIGVHDERNISRAVHTAVMLSLGSGIILTILGVWLARPILHLLAAPDSVLDLAGLYLMIYFTGMPFIMLYNFCAAILRSKGDTKRPLAALSAAGIINVLLNLLFVVVLNMSVAGVALATVISNLFSSLLLVRWLCQEKGALRLYLDRQHLKMDWKILQQFAVIGIPAGIQGVVFSLSNVIIQSAINKLGPLYMAGNTAAVNFEIVSYFVYNAFNSAALTFISQNYAAGKLDRCRHCAIRAFVWGQICGFVINGFFIATRGSTIAVFSAEQAVIAIAEQRLLIILSFEFFNGSIELLSGILRGYGKSVIPAVTAVIGICGVRILVVLLLPDGPYAYQLLMAAYPLSWIITSSVLFFQYLRLQKHVNRQSAAVMQTAAM